MKARSMKAKKIGSKIERTPRSKKIRVGDKVLVITGASKGQTGTVLRYVGERVIIQGLNLKKKHVKPSQQNPKGGVIQIEGPIHISNIAPCDENGMKLKLKVETDAQGARQFYSTKNGERVVHRSLKSKLA